MKLIASVLPRHARQRFSWLGAWTIVPDPTFEDVPVRARRGADKPTEAATRALIDLGTLHR